MGEEEEGVVRAVVAGETTETTVETTIMGMVEERPQVVLPEAAVELPIEPLPRHRHPLNQEEELQRLLMLRQITTRCRRRRPLRHLCRQQGRIQLKWMTMVFFPSIIGLWQY